MEDLTGKQFGTYRIISSFGEGGMATVYKAYQASMDRHVALKVLPRFHSADPEFLGRFEQEAKALAELQHPHILPVYDFGESEGYTYFVMPLMRVGNLAELLGDRQLPLEKIHQIISQVGSALEFAHSRGFIHRDVKPSNILLDESGNCTLMDFGIAKIIEGSKEFTRTGGILGTPVYMSPEQGSGQKIDSKSDIYSLGIILYEMVTGRPPFDAETPVAVIFKHVHDPLPPPSSFKSDLSDEVESVILKSLAKNPEDRYKNVREMVDALSQAVTISMHKEQTKVDLPQTVKEYFPGTTQVDPDLPEQEMIAAESPVQIPSEKVLPEEVREVRRSKLKRLRPLLIAAGVVSIIIVGIWRAGSESRFTTEVSDFIRNPQEVYLDEFDELDSNSWYWSERGVEVSDGEVVIGAGSAVDGYLTNLNASRGNRAILILFKFEIGSDPFMFYFPAGTDATRQIQFAGFNDTPWIGDSNGLSGVDFQGNLELEPSEWYYLLTLHEDDEIYAWIWAPDSPEDALAANYHTEDFWADKNTFFQMSVAGKLSIDSYTVFSHEGVQSP